MINVEARATKDAPLEVQACASLASRAKVPSLTFGLEVTALQIRLKAATTVGWSISPGWPKTLTAVECPYADGRSHTQAFASAYVVCDVTSISASTRSINEREINSRCGAHLYKRGCRCFDDKPV